MPLPPIRRPARVRAACLLTAGLFALAGCGATAAAGSGAGPATADPLGTAPRSPASQAPPGSGPASPSAAAPTAYLEVKGRTVTGPRTLDVPLGTRVVIDVVGDTADDIHVHGYNVRAKLVAGVRTRISFMAGIPGIFDVELHRAGLRLCEVRVR
jgi:hypothetical protein